MNRSTQSDAATDSQAESMSEDEQMDTDSIDGSSEDTESQRDLAVTGHIKSLSYLFDIALKTKDKRRRKATCKICSKSWKDYKPGQLVKHARKCVAADQDLVAELIDDYESYKNSRKKRAEARHGNELQNFRAAANQDLVDLVAVEMLALLICGSKYFERFCHRLNSDYNLPDRHVFVDQLLPERARKLASEALELIKRAHDYSLTIEFDCWTAVNQLSLLAITVTDSTGASTLLDLVDVHEERHTANYLYTCVNASLDKLDRIKIGCIISDDASNCRNARGRLAQESQIIETRCLAHLANLITGSASKHILVAPTLQNLREIVNIFNRTKSIASYLKQKGALRLIRAVPTRWHTTSFSVTSLLKIQALIEQMPHTELYASFTWRPLIAGGFWTDLKLLEKYFTFISEIVKLAETPRARISQVTRKLMQFVKILVEMEPDKFRDVFLVATLVHWQRANLPLLLSAYFFDPTYRADWLTVEARKLVRRFSAALLMDMGRLSTDEDVNKPQGELLYSELVAYTTQLASRSPGVEVDLIPFWKRSTTTYLKVVAIRVAFIHPSSANTERFFSAMNSTLTPKRNKMSRETLQDLITVRTRVMSTGPSRSSNFELSSEEKFKESAESALFGFEDEDEADDIVLGQGDVLKSSLFKEFSKYIDFSVSINFNPITNEQAGRRTSDQASQRLMDAIEAGHQNESDNESQ